MKESRTSAPIRLLQMVWDHKHAATGHSWLKTNHAMSDATSLAIRSGMEFELDDFGAMSIFRPGYWRSIENCYRDAVLYRNSSAYLAIEKHLGRKPFIFHGASIGVNTGDGPCGQGLARLIVGAEFVWNKERVTVTSFNDGKGSLVACSYFQRETVPCPRCPKCWSCGSHGQPKVLHRITITNADMKQIVKASRPPKAKKGSEEAA